MAKPSTPGSSGWGDAARFVGEALLAQQGLRPTQAGGHLAVSDAVRAQFGGPLSGLGSLRRRPNELEYPIVASTTDSEDAARALAAGVIEAKLGACARIVGPITSVYRWEGEVQSEQEWWVEIKTGAALDWADLAIVPHHPGSRHSRVDFLHIDTVLLKRIPLLGLRVGRGTSIGQDQGVGARNREDARR